MNISTGAASMITTDQFLDLLKSKHGSDYKTSLALGKSPSYVSAVRSGKGTFSDEVGLKAAELLDFPKDAMLLCLAAERSYNSPAFTEIRRLAEKHIPKEKEKTLKKSAG